ncbi:MAG: proline--tRNA ligase, partial [Rhodothermales bacterium]
DTLCIEALMQDGKALQAGTSHFLGQNFAKAFGCQFQNKENQLEYVWATSWGVSTRLIGGLIMTHSDDQGMVMPPKLAPTQVVIVPILRKDGSTEVLEAGDKIVKSLKEAGIRVKFDTRTGHRPGWKFAEYEVKGVPIRLALGPRDVENGMIELARRDTFEKESVPQEGLVERIKETLDAIQKNLFDKAVAFREENTTIVNSYDEFKEVINDKGGFVLAHWDGTEETETKIKNDTKATIRCIPFAQTAEMGVDMISGEPSAGRVYFAKSY